MLTNFEELPPTHVLRALIEKDGGTFKRLKEVDLAHR